jgi:hypothetical protein
MSKLKNAFTLEKVPQIRSLSPKALALWLFADTRIWLYLLLQLRQICRTLNAYPKIP